MAVLWKNSEEQKVYLILLVSCIFRFFRPATLLLQKLFGDLATAGISGGAVLGQHKDHFSFWNFQHDSISDADCWSRSLALDHSPGRPRWLNLIAPRPNREPQIRTLYSTPNTVQFTLVVCPTHDKHTHTHTHTCTHTTTHTRTTHKQKHTHTYTSMPLDTHCHLFPDCSRLLGLSKGQGCSKLRHTPNSSS